MFYVVSPRALHFDGTLPRNFWAAYGMHLYEFKRQDLIEHHPDLVPLARAKKHLPRKWRYFIDQRMEMDGWARALWALWDSVHGGEVGNRI